MTVCPFSLLLFIFFFFAFASKFSFCFEEKVKFDNYESNILIFNCIIRLDCALFNLSYIKKENPIMKAKQ